MSTFTLQPTLEHLSSPRPIQGHSKDCMEIRYKYIIDELDKLHVEPTHNPMEEFRKNGCSPDDVLSRSPPKEEAFRVPKQPAASRRYHESDILCPFCRNNGETPKVYRSHAIRDSKGKVTCPVLRRYTCPICQASGDKAHTISYCPMQNKPAVPPTSNATPILHTGTPQNWAQFEIDYTDYGQRLWAQAARACAMITGQPASHSPYLAPVTPVAVSGPHNNRP